MLGLKARNILLRISPLRRAISTSLPASYPIVIRMPSLSPTMTEGTIVSWVKNEGEEISAGDSLCEIQTDKAVMTMDIEEEGVLAKILKKEGASMIAVGQPIAVIAEDGEDWQSLSLSSLDLEGVGADPGAAQSESKSRQSRDAEFPPLRDLATLKIGPAVRLLLELYRLSPHEIEIVGPHHRLLKGDVLAYIAEKGLKPQPPEAAPPPEVSSQPAAPVVKAPAPTAAPTAAAATATATAAAPASPAMTSIAFNDVTPTPAEAAAAQLAALSKRAVPHNYVSLDVKMDHVMEAAERAQLPVGPFILKAAAAALYAVPEANSFLTADGATVAAHPVVDLAVVSSVHRSSAPCLLRSVERMTCGDIAKELEKQANAEKSDAAANATFTVIDLTDSGIAHLAAVVTPPQAAVLALGGISADLSAVTGPPQEFHKATATLSIDCRVLDEAGAARFLAAFATALEMAAVVAPGVNVQSDQLDDLLGLEE